MLCSQCMCLILASTRCGTFPVHPFTPFFSPLNKKKVLACDRFRRSVKVGLFETLDFVIAVQLPVISLSLSLLQGTMEDVHSTHKALSA